jgi:hypothetical protein
MLAADLANGRGLSGSLRSLYSMLLALIFVWTGPSVFVAKLVNIVLHSLSVSVGSSIFARIFNLQVGLATAIFLLLDFGTLRLTHALLSEHAGLIFFTLSIFFVLGPFGVDRRAISSVLSGVFLGLSNLARPLTLLSAFVFISYLFKSEGRALARARNSLFFVLGLMVCMSPWIIRQKAVFGTYSISTNAMEAFWAATDPKWGTWSHAAIADARREKAPREPAESERFFREKAFQNLCRNPVFYVGNVAASFWKSLNWPIPPGGALAAALVLLTTALASTSPHFRQIDCSPSLRRFGESRPRGASSGAAVLSVFVCIATIWGSPGALVLLGVAFSMLFRIPRVGILAGSLFCALLVNSAFAVPWSRLNHIFDWLRLGFLVYGWQQTLIWLLSQLRKKNINLRFMDRILWRGMISSSKWYAKTLAPVVVGSTGQVAKTAVFLLLGLITVSISMVITKNVIAAPLVPLERLSLAKKREILVEIMERNRNLISHNDVMEALDEKRVRSPRIDGRLIADVVEFPYFGYHIHAGAEHHYPMFQNRPYERTVFHLRSAIYGMRYLIVPGKVSVSLLRSRAVVVARLHQLEQQTCLEAVALVPIESTNNHLLSDRQITFGEGQHRVILNKISGD